MIVSEVNNACTQTETDVRQSSWKGNMIVALVNKDTEKQTGTDVYDMGVFVTGRMIVRKVKFKVRLKQIDAFVVL